MTTARTLILLLLLSAALYAQQGMSVAPYSFGVGIGKQGSFTSELKDDSLSHLFTLTQNNVWLLNKSMGITLDAEWLSLKNWSILTGFELLVGKTQIRPLFGLSGGVGATSHAGNFSDGFGFMAKAQAGVQVDITKNFGMKFKVPYRIIFNETMDQMLGGELSFIWYGKFKNIETIM